jgi:hypothetical protein
MTIALRHGRWTQTTSRLKLVSGAAWIALLSWWLAAGAIFVSPTTNEGTRGALTLVILIVVATIGFELLRRKPRIKVPNSIR